MSDTLNISQSPSGLLSRRSRECYTAPFGELGRVAEQIEEVLTQLRLVRMHFPEIALEVQHETVSVFRHQWRDCRLDIAQQVGDVESFQENFHLVCLDLRQIEDVVDEREEMAAGRGDLFQFRDELVHLLFARIFDQHLAVANNRVQWSAQFVAHGREEAALGFICRFSMALGPLEFDLSLLQFRDVGVNGNGAAVRSSFVC